MKKISILFLIYSLSACAQNVTIDDDTLKSNLVPYRKGYNWGYANHKMESIIETKYTYAEMFNEYNLVRIATGGPNHSERNYGYINIQGKEIIPPSKYRYVTEFEDSMAIYQKTRNDSIFYGVLDIQGQELISDSPNSLKLMGNGIIQFEEYQLLKGIAIRKFGLLNKSGDTIVPAKLVYYYPFINGYAVISKQGIHQNGLIDQFGEMVIPFEYEYVFLRDRLDPYSYFNENKYLTGDLIPVFKNTKWGFINFEGKVVIPLIYESVSYFDEELSRAQFKTENGKKYGLINREGKIIVPFEYDYIGEFNSGLCPVRKAEKSGYVNKKGEIVIPLKYDLVGIFHGGLARVGNKTNKHFEEIWGFIDTSGTEIIPIQYERVDHFQYEITRVVKDGKSGCINRKGEVVIPIEHYQLGILENYIFVSNKNGQSTIFDQNNTQIFPFSETPILPFHDHPDLFIITRFPFLEWDWDYIDKAGNKYFED